MTTTRHIPDKASSPLILFIDRLDRMLPPKAFFFLCAVILLLALLASVTFKSQQPLFTEGEIASSDVMSDSTYLLRDKQATLVRQDMARKMQPLVLDLTTLPVELLRERMQQLLVAVNGAHTTSQKDAVRAELAAELGEEITAVDVAILAAPLVQNAIAKVLLPQVEERLRNGVLPDPSLVRSYAGGTIIRNMVTGEEVLNADTHNIPDLASVRLFLSQEIKLITAFSPQAKQTVLMLFDCLLRPTLIPNYEATNTRAESAALAVPPVSYRVLKGEVIVQQGDRVTREQQLKMQLMLRRTADPFQAKTFLGISLFGLLMAGGLLFSPSGKESSTMRNKDFIFLAALLAVFALIAKGLAAHGEQIASVSLHFLPQSLTFALPVAGAAALSAQVFATRRYLVTGLLLAFFCAVMMDGGLALFLFFFLSAMWSTWLTNRSYTRRDVVWSVLPLTAGLLAMWAGATLLQGGAHNRYFSEMVAVAGSGIFSMVLTFALSPVVELIFGYTTRFRLMELLNLDQPLLRDLMLGAPGTYHHSLIVSNMCEAGAKRVGANGLLCKVAALYHDIGKLTKAGYFIENQPPDSNPHDRLSPSMSALVLISHVKQGVELANQHRLGPEVTDIIKQHHGNSIIQYFYRKALNMPDVAPPNIEDFRYPGPKPQTREAALVMLADIVEASSRTLEEPTPTRLHQHIEKVMKGVYSAGQLDESELTFKDISILGDSFQQVLRGLYHHRISYNLPSGKNKQPKPHILKPTEDAPPAYGGVPGEEEPATPLRTDGSPITQ